MGVEEYRRQPRDRAEGKGWAESGVQPLYSLISHNLRHKDFYEHERCEFCCSVGERK